LRFGRWRLGWLLFGGLLFLLMLRWLFNLFHFIFVSHGKYSSNSKNKPHPYEHHMPHQSVRCLTQQCNSILERNGDRGVSCVGASRSQREYFWSTKNQYLKRQSAFSGGEA
jgi:hypothetical protein